MSEGIAVGQLVRSRAGRDRGRAYLVVEVLPGSFVRVADGAGRRVAAAKRKNLRHLIVHRAVAAEIAEQAALGKLSDEQVRQALQRLLAEAERV
ncbi:MAG: KOW domain-containing RNA-binding protein [Bacillota bacterium]|nr:KOW domain-containing RNA-binding protein [Bacillota bacterium]